MKSLIASLLILCGIIIYSITTLADTSNTTTIKTDNYNKLNLVYSNIDNNMAGGLAGGISSNSANIKVAQY